MKKTLVQKAVILLKDGKIIAIPTETVYGLACDAKNDEAVKHLFELKGRPFNVPFSLLLSNDSQLKDWAIDIPQAAYQLSTAFWPGPLTMVLKKALHVSDLITANKNTVGLRIPAHPIALEILKALGRGIVATSANHFGEPDPVTFEETFQNFKNDVPLIIDGGPCDVGLASTVLDLTQQPFKILRQGKIIKEEIFSHIR